MEEEERNDHIYLAYIIVLFVMLIATVMLSTVSCSPRVYPTQRDTVNIVRTEVVEVLRDTIIYVPLPSDSVFITTRDTVSELVIKTAVSRALVSGGMLEHSLYSNPSYQPEIKVYYKDRVEYRDSVVYVNNTDVVQVEKSLNGWQRAMMAGGYILMGLTIAAVVVVVIRMRRRLL